MSKRMEELGKNYEEGENKREWKMKEVVEM